MKTPIENFATRRVRAEIADLSRKRDEVRSAAEAANRAKDEILALSSRDPDRMGRAVSLLVANAIKLTPVGGDVEVHVERAASGARIRVSVGGGIAAELATVKDLVQLYGGRVRADSAGSEGGATFTFDLPRPPGERAAPNLRESWQLVLDHHGAEVTAVGSASETLAALERLRPDVLFVPQNEDQGLKKKRAD